MVWTEFDSSYDLAPFTGVPRTYLIATTQRTGSHYLAHLLGARGDVGVPFEYLNDHRVLVELERRGIEDSDVAQIELLKEMKVRRTGSAGWFGIKAHWHTWSSIIERPALAAHLQPEKFIYLRRTDRIAQAASLALAELTGWWVDESQAFEISPTYSAARIQGALVRIERECEAWQEYFADQRRCLEVTYEELIDNPGDTLSAISFHLGVRDAGTVNPLFPSQRTRPDDIAEEWADRFRRQT